MTDAPERIWMDGDIEVGEGYWIRCFEDRKPCNEPALEYLRADHALALVAEALTPWIDLACESHGVTGFHLNGDVAEWDELDIPSAPSDALAAREARDKRVRAEALREAAAGIKEHTDTARKKMRMVYAAPVWSAIISHLDIEHDRILAALAETESRSE